MTDPTAGWHGFHLVYHADRERLLREAVAPLAAGLLRDGLISRFFVIHYLLGGPHLRLRVRCAPADAPAAAARVHESAAAFFARVPSTDTQPEGKVRAQNRRVIPSDPFATDADDVVWPDNHVAEQPVHFEVDRYGGPALYGHSVDLFGLSTLQAIRFADELAGAPEGRRTAERARLLLRQAWGHAGDGDELAIFADYGVRMFGKPLAALIPVADAAFERGRAGMVGLVRTELGALAAGGPAGPVANGARTLARHVAALEDEPRRFVGISQLHMTANRLGMRNPDEVYLCRMLSRAVQAVRDQHPDEWRAAIDAHGASRPPSVALDAQLVHALRAFAGEAPAAVA